MGNHLYRCFCGSHVCAQPMQWLHSWFLVALPELRSLYIVQTPVVRFRTAQP